MDALLEILLRASVSMALLYSLYWLLLRQSTHFKANRYFLLVSLLVSVIIAVVPVHYQVLTPAPSTLVLNDYNGVFKTGIANSNIEETTNGFSLLSLLYPLYFVGATIVLLRILIQCRKPLQVISQSTPKKINNCLVHENQVFNSPFSFLNRIFINPEYFQQNEISDILTHEKVHIHEHHWIDLFIIELLTVFFWFNPFIWLFERAIKQNHEYLADEGVLTRGHSPVRYQALLINRLMDTQVIGLANHFSSSLGPTRFKMMTKKKTAKRKLFRMAWGIPVLAILLVAFAEPEYTVQTDKEIQTTTVEREFKLSSKDTPIKVKGTVKDGNGNPLTDASIIIKGTNTGTIVDQKGNFELNIPKGIDLEMMISSVGYKTQTLPVKLSKLGSTPWEFDIVLKKDTIKTVSLNAGNGAYKANGKTTIKQILSCINKLKGKVVDEQGNPLLGAAIVIQGTSTGTVADKHGNFELNYSPKGKFNLIASFVGFKTASSQIKTSKEKNNILEYVFKLKREVIKIDSKALMNAGDIPPPPPTPENGESFFIVEEMPQYNQGFYGLAQYVKNQRSKLQTKFGSKLSGKATVGFTVDTKGNVTNIQVLEKSNDVIAEAVTFIASEMEKWKPGSQRGKNVSVDYAMELEF